jgi:hypothetical protein
LRGGKHPDPLLAPCRDQISAKSHAWHGEKQSAENRQPPPKGNNQINVSGWKGIQAFRVLAWDVNPDFSQYLNCLLSTLPPFRTPLKTRLFCGSSRFAIASG